MTDKLTKLFESQSNDRWQNVLCFYLTIGDGQSQVFGNDLRKKRQILDKIPLYLSPLNLRNLQNRIYFTKVDDRWLWGPIPALFQIFVHFTSWLTASIKVQQHFATNYTKHKFCVLVLLDAIRPKPRKVLIEDSKIGLAKWSCQKNVNFVCYFQVLNGLAERQIRIPIVRLKRKDDNPSRHSNRCRE